MDIRIDSQEDWEDYDTKDSCLDIEDGKLINVGSHSCIGDWIKDFDSGTVDTIWTESLMGAEIIGVDEIYLGLKFADTKAGLDSATEHEFVYPNDFPVPVFSYSGRWVRVRVSIAKGGECFVEGTKILMKDGVYKNIEDIRVGDFIISCQVKEEFEMSVSKVEEVYVSTSSKFVRINNLIMCTEQHPFYVLSYNKYIKAIKLKEGEFLSKFENEKVVLERIYQLEEVISKDIKIYNFRVSNLNNYFANGILVHNK